jgi:hypothetical protein
MIIVFKSFDSQRHKVIWVQPYKTSRRSTPLTSPKIFIRLSPDLNVKIFNFFRDVIYERSLTQFGLKVIPEDRLFEVGNGRQEKDEQDRAEEAADDGEEGRGHENGFGHLHAAEGQDRQHRGDHEGGAFVEQGHF